MLGKLAQTAEQFIAPMLARLESSVPTTGYAYEVKWDGVRAIVVIHRGALQIFSRNNLVVTAAYPELEDLAKHFKNRSVILDGEIVALNAKGLPDFELLQHRMHVRDMNAARKLSKSTPVTLMVFDVLTIDGESMLEKPYIERRAILANLKLNAKHWQTPDYFTGDAEPFLKATKDAGIEGIIAKRIDSIYTPGKRSDAWLKIKHILKQEFVIAGWQDGEGARSGIPGALLLGYFDALPDPTKRKTRPQRLVYCGKVGTGFSVKSLRSIHELLKKSEITQNPFDVDPPRERAVHYTRPELVAEIQFTEWTSTHMLRHPSFQGLRNDKAPHDVIREM